MTEVPTRLPVSTPDVEAAPPRRRRTLITPDRVEDDALLGVQIMPAAFGAVALPTLRQHFKGFGRRR